MSSLNTSHALEVGITALLVGTMSLLVWRNLNGRGTKREVDDERAIVARKGFRPALIASSFALGYAILSFAFAFVIALLIIFSEIGLGSSVESIVEVLSRVESQLAS